MRENIQFQRLLWAGLVLGLALPGCGGADTPTGEAAPVEAAPADQEAVVTEVPDEAAEAPVQAAPVTPPVTILPEPPSTIAAIRETVLVRATDAARVEATLFQLMSISLPGGRESSVFHFEDTINTIDVGCSGHAILLPIDDGAAFEVASIAAGCGQIAVEAPITVFPSRGYDENGGEVVVIYGEIYDASVVAIRIFYDGGQEIATISGGAYQAWLPANAAGIEIIAYDAGGAEVFNGSPGN